MSNKVGWASIFFMMFLTGGGIIIGVNYYSYASTHTFEIALMSLVSFFVFMLLLYWDDLKSRILGESAEGS